MISGRHPVLQFGQGLPPWIHWFLLRTSAFRGAFQSPTSRAQPRTLFSAQGLHGEFQQELLNDNIARVYLVTCNEKGFGFLIGWFRPFGNLVGPAAPNDQIQINPDLPAELSQTSSA